MNGRRHASDIMISTPENGRGSPVLAGQGAAALADVLDGRADANHATAALAPAAEPLAAAPVIADPISPPGATRGRVARLLHRAALTAKPYLQPVLRRVEARIGTAVNKSESLIRLQSDVSTLQSTLVRRIDAVVAQLRANQETSARHGPRGAQDEMLNLARAHNDSVETLRRKVEALDRPRSDSVETLRAELEQLRGYVELLLQRFAFPLGAGLLAARNRYGYLVLPTADPANVGYLVEGVLPEQGTLAVLEALLSPGDVFVDLGANVGLFTLAAARRVGPAGRVVSVEPAADLVVALRALAQLNQIAGVVDVREVAAGEAEGTAELFLASTSGHNSLFAEQAGLASTRVRVAPLDALLEPGTAVSVVKMDVEGAELRALAGMRRVIADNPALVVIAEFSPAIIRRSHETPAQWIATARAMGFDILEIDEQAQALRPLRAEGLEEAAWINLALHGQQARARLAPLTLRAEA